MNPERYFYVINYPDYEEKLCMMEMRYLFGFEPDKKYFFHNKYINPSRSVFIKEVIKVMYEENDFESIIQKMRNDDLQYDEYKVIYVKIENDNLSYKERLNNISRLGYEIIGDFNLHEPKNILCIVKTEDKWVFGEYESNDFTWRNNIYKPKSYSRSLSVRMAKSIVNIAVGDNLDLKVVDPCCGVGTVVIEALKMGIDTYGYEISEDVANNAKTNLRYFDLNSKRIIHQDMTTVTSHYDVAIIDIPYGLFSHVSDEDTVAIIEGARRIASKLVLVSLADMDELLNSCGFKVIDKSVISKNNFDRYLTICI